MWLNLARYLLVLVLVLPIKGSDSSGNGTLSGAREPRANRRIVRLYSGTRPKPILCAREGFQADPSDCTVFHRCMKNGNGKYLTFRFQCSPGTIYDPETEICNHPERTKRINCGINVPTPVPNIEFSFDNDISKEVPSPISTRHPDVSQNDPSKLFTLQTTHRAVLSSSATKYPWANYFSESTLSTPSSTKRQDVKTTKIHPTKRQVTELFENSDKPSWMSSQKSHSTTPRIVNRMTTQAGDSCTSSGFMGDSENCRKFYRCIHNQRGGFIRYEFMCSEPTIWDDEKQACNYAWAVKRRRCGRGNLVDNKELTITDNEAKESIVDKSHNVAPDSTQSQSQINYGSKVTQIQTQISNGSVIQNQTQINYSQDVHNNTVAPNVLQNQTQISQGSAISQTQTQINYGDKAVQTQLQIDHSKDSSQSQTQISESTSTSRTTQHHEPQTTSNANTNNFCTKSGFVGDPEDCEKFYRCVDDGKGGYTRYEFSCGEGTVWDSKIESCNHAWAVKECGSKAPSNPSTTQSTTLTTKTSSKPTESSSSSTLSSTTTTTTQNYYSSTEEEDNDIPYGNQPTASQSTSTTPQQETTSNKAPQSSNDNSCKSTGFMGDSNDCKKFYRCVDNGNGGYTRYEFSCGEGTVWDQTIEACNHAWAVDKCGKNSGTSTSNSAVQTTTTQSTPQTSSHLDDYDTGYGSQHDEPLSSSSTVSTTTVKSSSTTISQNTQTSESNKGNDCTSSGFMGDDNDCKKFYRCVDNGNGGYTKYEFTCGEGTVWDPKIQACNHAWAVEKCGGTAVEDINKEETTTQKDIEGTPTSSSTTPEPDEDNDVGYGQQSKEPQPATSTSRRPDSDNNECKSSGFMGDKNDCKKFYRCVDNGDGKFTRYEFSCGEGTVWDSTIDACNHVWAVKTPCSQSGSTMATNNVQSTTQMSNVDQETEPDDQGYNEPATQKTSPSPTSKPTGNNCKQEGFYGDESDCKNFYRCVDNGQGGFTKYEFTCGDGTVWNQEIQACDHESSDKKCGANISVSTSTQPEKENDEISPESSTKDPASTTSNTENNYTSQKPQTSDNKCNNEGFYGDTSDCKKFYRCVDDGKGGFTKYDFTCGDGTVWDQEILACNHESSKNKCKGSAVSTSTTVGSQETGMTESSTNSPTQQTTHQEEVTSSSNENDQCETEGFFANSNDCKKFYRCVSDGKGGFTKYDFSCGEGTVWVQEIQACDYDNDISNCSKQDSQTTQGQQMTTTVSTTTSQYTTQSQSPDKENDEYPSSSSTTSSSSSKPPTESEKCSSEGFFANENDCRQFYRCVDNGEGGYTKYDFTCGEGTAWDTDLQTCNHINEVQTCQNTNNQGSQSQPSNDQESSQSESTSTTKDGTSTESSKPSNTDKCDQEGYFGNTEDCTRFYRCVDNGKGGFTKYDFTCGEGTIWDQDVTTCNHPQDVVHPSCTNKEGTKPSSNESSSTEGSGTSSSSSTQSSQSTTEGNNGGSSNCSQESSSKKPSEQKVTCEKAGYYPDPDDCKKFYRCVDWDGNGEKFSVYHFECGEGTIWDPSLDTCNHEDSVYPPRDCKRTENASQGTTTTEKSTTSEDNNTTESSTTTQSSTEESTTTQISSTTESTTQSTTTEKTTTTTQQSTTEKTTTSSSTTTQQTTTDKQEQTTQESTTSEQTTQESTTSEQTTQGSTTSEQTTAQQTTTQQSTTSEQTTTPQQSATTEPTTTQQSTTSEQTTQQSTSSEQTTEGTTTESTTTDQTLTTTEQSSEQNTTEQSTTGNTTEQENSTTESSTTTTTESSTTSTESSDTTTTESDQGTTAQETSSEKECPETDDDQYLYVCPTSFRRHPKYCNMFYQCTEDDDSHEVKIANFKCPNNTIYDESKTQCVEEDKADKPCNGQIAQRYRVKRLNADHKELIEVSRKKHACPAVGYYPFENDECSEAFLKCKKTKSGKLRGYVHRCPEGYMYWSISKRCERKGQMKDCKRSANTWRGRWEIPVEKYNIDK